MRLPSGGWRADPLRATDLRILWIRQVIILQSEVSTVISELEIPRFLGVISFSSELEPAHGEAFALRS